MAEETRRATIIARACVALAAVTVLVFVIDLLAGPFFSLSTRTWAPERRGARLIGGIEGAVKGADVSTSTVRVASGFLGLASLPVVITPQTQIVINGKLGGFADLDRGQLVRLAYEVLPDRLVARRVDVLDRVTSGTVVPAQIEGEPAVELPSHDEQRAPRPAAGTASEPPPRAKTSSSPASPPAEAPASASSLKASSPSSVPPWRAAPSVASPPSASAPPTRQNASSAPPSRRAVVAPSSSPRTQVQDPPPSAPVPAPRPSAPATVPPRAGQAADGGDAIDWLLKESATRGQ